MRNSPDTDIISHYKDLVARHESGHMLAAILEGQKVHGLRNLEIQVTGKEGEYVLSINGTASIGTDSQEETPNEMFRIAIAGPAAEPTWYPMTTDEPSATKSGNQNDMLIATNALQTLALAQNKSLSRRRLRNIVHNTQWQMFQMFNGDTDFSRAINLIKELCLHAPSDTTDAFIRKKLELNAIDSGKIDVMRIEFQEKFNPITSINKRWWETY